MLSDLELLGRVASRDEEAFVIFVGRHQGSLERYVRCHLHDAQGRDDCIQDVLVTVLERAASFEGRSSARTWLLGIARFKILQRLDARTRALQRGEDWAALGERAGWGAPQVEASLELARVREAMARLEPMMREILILRDIEGFTTRESAALLEIGEAAVKSRLHRARLKLMALLRDEVEP